MNRIDLFFELIKYFKSGDDTHLDDKVIAVANEEYETAQQHFTQVLDLPAFRGSDYDKIRDLLVAWYAAGRTIVRLHRLIGDVYAMDDVSLKQYIRSLGFPYPDYVPKKNRATFLLDLVNLYKIKGTPKALESIIQYLGYVDFKIYEYWLTPPDPKFANQRTFKGIPVNESSLLPDVLTYSEDYFTKKDPLWRTEDSQIVDTQLPSLTPYFGLISVQYCTKNWIVTYAAFSAIVKTQYQQWKESGTLVRSTRFATCNLPVSFLELMLALWWTFYVTFGYIDLETNEVNPDKFATLVPDNLMRHICYAAAVGKELDKAQLEEDYDRLFNAVPKSREEVKQLLEERKEVFTWENNYSILPDPRDIATLLKTINPDLYTCLYHQLLYSDISTKRHLMNEMFSELENILGALDLVLTTFENKLIFEGQAMYAVINFFKPIHARLVQLGFILNIGDHVAEQFFPEDYLQQIIIQWIKDHEDTNLHDYLDMTLIQDLFDKEKVKDYLQQIITQLLTDKELPTDKMGIGFIVNFFDYARSEPQFYDGLWYSYDTIGAMTDVFRWAVLQIVNEQITTKDTNILFKFTWKFDEVVHKLDEYHMMLLEPIEDKSRRITKAPTMYDRGGFYDEKIGIDYSDGLFIEINYSQ